MESSFPLDCSRLGLLGGSFDPIHVGHLIIADTLAYRLDLDHVVFLPAANPPHKTGQPLSSPEARLEMIRLSIAGVSGFSASEADLRREGPSYTVDMLTEIRQKVSDRTQLCFLMGMDSLRDFPNWHRPGEIAALAELGVARRPGVDVSQIDIEFQVPEARGRIQIINVPLIDIASSNIRERVRTKRPFRFHVTPAVAEYIIGNRLYESSARPGSDLS